MAHDRVGLPAETRALLDALAAYAVALECGWPIDAHLEGVREAVRAEDLHSEECERCRRACRRGR